MRLTVTLSPNERPQLPVSSIFPTLFLWPGTSLIARDMLVEEKLSVCRAVSLQNVLCDALKLALVIISRCRWRVFVAVTSGWASLADSDWNAEYIKHCLCAWLVVVVHQQHFILLQPSWRGVR
jgi:hypothetical protein